MDHKFQVNLRGIIDLLSEHIYSSPEVFVRELLQNAVDAITARTQLQPEHVGDILIECHSPKGKPPTVVVTENGIGLTLDEVHTFLSTIGLSSKRTADGQRPGDFIGQFGVGILSCFVVSEEIVVITRTAKDPAAKPIEWRAKGDGTYTVKELDRDFEPGTQVWLTAKPGLEHLFAPDQLTALCRQYGGLLPYPIRITAGRSTTTINDEPPPWRQHFRSDKDRTKALLRFGKATFQTDFFDAVVLQSTPGKLDGVAFILPHAVNPSAKLKHRVYLKNMFLAESADALLPDWAFFVRVVVNAHDLRPTASRESFYEDAKLAKARTAVGECLRKYLCDLAENRPERLEKFVAIHQRAIKALAVDDDEFYRLMIDWLPFETTLGERPFAEIRAETDRIRYVPSVDSFRQMTRVAAAQGVMVVNAGYVHDAELLAKAGDAFPHLTVESIDPNTLTQSFDDLTPADQDRADDFLRLAETVLKPFACSADAKRFEPAELPVIYSTSQDGRFYRSLEQTKEVADPLWSGVLDGLSKRDKAILPTAQLCFNFANPLVQKLAHLPPGGVQQRAVQMLYVQALLLGHHPLNAREMTILNDGLLGLITAAIGEQA